MNLVPGDLVKLTLGGLILADCVGRLETSQVTEEYLLQLKGEQAY